MTEAEQTAVDKLPLSAQPWAHLLNFGLEKTHQITSSFVLMTMLILGCVYVWPKIVEQGEGQKATQAELAKLTKHQEEVAAKAMPLLEEATQAIPLLRQLNQKAEVGNQQRHDDLTKKAD